MKEYKPVQTSYLGFKPGDWLVKPKQKRPSQVQIRYFYNLNYKVNGIMKDVLWVALLIKGKHKYAQAVCLKEYKRS